MAVKHLKCGQSELRCVKSLKYTVAFEEFVWEKDVNGLISTFYIGYMSK